MYGILVYKFLNEDAPLQRERFLLHLGKIFDTCEPITKDVFSFTLTYMDSSTMDFVQELKNKFAVDVFISLHYVEEDKDSVFCNTAN